MSNLRQTKRVHQILRSTLKPGDYAVDATVGNGYDILFLAQSVHPGGHVFGFDIQQSAIGMTQARLQTAGLASAASLHTISHEHMAATIPIQYHKKIKVVIFNLGYLPGSNKACITQKETTLIALKDSITLLSPSGIISILAYPGHEGGNEETNAVLDWAESIKGKYAVEYYKKEETSKPAPILIIVKMATN